MREPINWLTGRTLGGCEEMSASRTGVRRGGNRLRPKNGYVIEGRYIVCSKRGDAGGLMNYVQNLGVIEIYDLEKDKHMLGNHCERRPGMRSYRLLIGGEIVAKPADEWLVYGMMNGVPIGNVEA